jgi:hypothetical protein
VGWGAERGMMEPVTWSEIRGSYTEWDRRVEIAEELRTKIRKLHRQAYYTNKDVVMHVLGKAERRARYAYLEQVVVLARMAPGYIYRLYEACVERRKFLEQKLDMMQRVWRPEMFEQFQKTLLDYELIYDQVEMLEGLGEKGSNGQPSEVNVVQTSLFDTQIKGRESR